MTDGPVAGILNGPVTLDMPDGSVITVLDSPVGFDVGDGLVTAVRDPLRKERFRKKAAKEKSQDD